MLKNELMRKPLEQQYFAIYRDHVPYTLFARNFYLFGVNLCVLTSSLHQRAEDLLTMKFIDISEKYSREGQKTTTFMDLRFVLFVATWQKTCR